MTTNQAKNGKRPETKPASKNGARNGTKAAKKSRSVPGKGIPYGLLLVCAVLAGWSFWTAGIFDGEIADELRTSSVYADPGFDLDIAAAEQAIGNRRLAAVFLDTEDVDAAREVCSDVERSADGVLVVILFRDGAELDDYGCSWLYGDNDDAIGKNLVAETQITDGADGFADRPLLTVKQMATNYDQLVRSDTVPGQAREIHASAPRYLLAFVALGAVVLGAGALYLVGRRAGRLAADQTDTSIAERDADVRLQARLAGIAATILRLDSRLGRAPKAWTAEYHAVCTEYTDLAEAAGRPEADLDGALTARVDTLAGRVDELHSDPSVHGFG